MIDADKLRRTLDSRGYVHRDVSRECGFSERTLMQVLHRGECGMDFIDRVACYLGCHMSEFEVTE